MTWKAYVPTLGDKTLRQKIRELEREAGTLPVIFALFFFEFLKSTVASIPVGVTNNVKYLIMAGLVAIIFVREELLEKLEETKDG